ncbi:MAG: hypothetical protein ABEJ66_03190, partial [Candidatus Nanohaloarchaea archaeon]
MISRRLYYLKKTLEVLDYSREELENFQERLLGKVLESYGKRQPGGEREVSGLSGLEDIDRMGILRREDLNLEPGEVTGTRQTSGTTGSPLEIDFDEQADDWLSAVQARTLYLQGYLPTKLIAHQGEWPVDQGSWLGEKLIRRIKLEGSIEEQVETIQREEPD